MGLGEFQLGIKKNPEKNMLYEEKLFIILSNNKLGPDGGKHISDGIKVLTKLNTLTLNLE